MKEGMEKGMTLGLTKGLEKGRIEALRGLIKRNDQHSRCRRLHGNVRNGISRSWSIRIPSDSENQLTKKRVIAKIETIQSHILMLCCISMWLDIKWKKRIPFMRT